MGLVFGVCLSAIGVALVGYGVYDQVTDTCVSGETATLHETDGTSQGEQSVVSYDQLTAVEQEAFRDVLAEGYSLARELSHPSEFPRYVRYDETIYAVGFGFSDCGNRGWFYTVGGVVASIPGVLLTGIGGYHTYRSGRSGNEGR